MWIHLVALGLISGASSGEVPPEVQQFIHYVDKGSNSSTAARKRWADKQQPTDAQVKAATAKEGAATGAELVALKALALKQAQQQTDATSRSNAKADAQQQVLEAFRQALINEQQTAQWLFEQDDEDAIVALLLSL